jgi:hypothetical protein
MTLAYHWFGHDEFWILNMRYLLLMFSAGAVENKAKLMFLDLKPLLFISRVLSFKKVFCNLGRSAS